MSEIPAHFTHTPQAPQLTFSLTVKYFDNTQWAWLTRIFKSRAKLNVNFNQWLGTLPPWTLISVLKSAIFEVPH
jgi:hypothetical protein